MATAAHDDRSLILIKHALPEIAQDVPSHLWRLSSQGRAGAERLATAITHYTPDVLVTSVEPKAAETGQIVARLLSIPCRTAPGLQENDRTGLPYLDAKRYETIFRRFFRHPDDLVVGCETARQAGSRFVAAVDTILASHQGESIAVVAHGTVISLFLAARCDLDPFLAWQRLGLPSFVVLSLPHLRVERFVDTLSQAEPG